MAPQQVNVLLVGASSVGKTTLLERIKVTQFQKQGVVVVEDDSPFLQEQMYHQEADEEELREDSSSSSLASPLPTSLPGRIVSRRRVVEPNSESTTTTTTTTTPTTTTTRPNRKGLWVCPSPPKYQNTVTDDEDDDEVLLSDKEVLETIHIHNSLTTLPPPSSTTASTIIQQQYDLKPNTRMLPFQKIRPTIGMNLGQFKNIYGAKCHVWDVGGRLHDLWERYYEDCDAVLFVYKWEEEEKEEEDEVVTNEDDDRPRPPTRQEQKVLLQTVRQNIPEDVPFLIFLHSWQSPTYEMYQSSNRIYRSTEPLLPTLPTQALCIGNAGTGQGVRAAMEWLLPLAKQQQQRVRDKLPAE
jgi:GTPase SAR1 family protein